MQVKIRRKAKTVWSKQDEKLVAFVLDFAMDKLGLWASGERLDVILRGAYANGSYGDSIDLDSKVMIRISKKENWVKTLFHELEHVRQYIDDELELEQKSAAWKGEIYSSKDEDYWDSPWEVQAREVEEKLYKQFRKYILTLSA